MSDDEKRPGGSVELTEGDQKRLHELDEAISKFEQQKRWSDVIKSLLAKADIVLDEHEKVRVLLAAGQLSIERSVNQTQAITCFERALEVDRLNAEAIARLKEIYDKRRDWEKLVRIMDRETELLDGDALIARLIELAGLALERVRKPELAVELWKRVQLLEPDHPEALNQLATLYERVRDYAHLAEVLERRLELTSGREDQKALLVKLGMLYGDRLSDDAGAIRAFRRLLELDPEERRAQEQLKKRYVALKDWDALEEFFSIGEKWDELIRVLEREADAPEAAAELKISLAFRVAQLWLEKKGKPDRAARWYERVLEIDADNLDAALALAPIYQKSGDGKRLAASYEVRLKHVDDPNERLELLRETAGLYETKVKDPSRAQALLLEAFAIEPTHEEIRAELKRVSTATKDWEPVLRAYKSAVADAPDSVATSLRLELANALNELGRSDEAVAEFERVSDEDPSNVDALLGLEKLYLGKGDSKSLLRTVDRLLDLAPSEEERLRLAYQRASIFEDALGDVDGAISAYQQIIKSHGDGETRSFKALERLFEKSERWLDLAVVLEQRLDLATTDREEVTSLRFRLAKVLQTQLDDSSRALELYREVLLAMPEHDGARESLESMLTDKKLRAGAARVLESVHEAQGDWVKVIADLEVLVISTDDPGNRAELLGKIGDIYRIRLADLGWAFQAYSRALREVPSDRDVFARLESVSLEHGRDRDLVELVAELARSVEDPELRRELWSRIARIQEERLNDVNGAVTAYTHVLEDFPTDVGTLDALETLFRRVERWSDVLGVLRRRVDATDVPEARRQVLEQMAQIADELLTKSEQAIALYGEVLELYPDDAATLRALDRLYTKLSSWPELADNLERQFAQTHAVSDQVELMLRLGELRELRMGAVEAAIQLYREVLDKEPSNPRARASLERLLTDAKYEFAVAEVLEPLYRALGEYERLIGVHEVQLRGSENPFTRVEILWRIAELAETALDDPRRAFGMLGRALSQDPSQARTLAELERLSGITGDWQSFATVVEKQLAEIKQQPDAEDQRPLLATLHSKAASLRERELGDAEGAIAHYREVVGLDAEDFDALGSLERLYMAGGLHEPLAETLIRKAEVLRDDEERKASLRRASEIYETVLEKPKDAERALRLLLNVDKEDLRALDRLIAIHTALSEWEELLLTYMQKVDALNDPDERRDVYANIGDVYERHLRDRPSAIENFVRVLELDPSNTAALQRLDALYLAEEKWRDLLAVLEREADCASDPADSLNFKFRAGQLWELQLGDASRAVEIYRSILDLDPSHPQTRVALEKMVAADREAVAASLVLEPLYRAEGNGVSVVDMLEVQVAHDSDTVKRVELLHRIAELFESELEAPQKGFAALRRALVIDSTDDRTLLQLERLAERLSVWGELAQAYDAALVKLREEASPYVADLASRLASIFELRLADLPSAIERYAVVIEVDEIHAGAISALDRLYEATARWEEQIEILRRAILIAPTPDDVIELQFRIGQVYHLRLADAAKATEQYKEILSAAPEHTPSLSALEALLLAGASPREVAEVLEPLYRMQESWERLVSLQGLVLAHTAEADERQRLLRKGAELAEERLSDQARALDWWVRALLESPDGDGILIECVRLAEATGEWAVLAAALAELLETESEIAIRTRLGLELAKIYEERLDALAKAETTYRYVLGFAPASEEALEALDRIYLATEAWEGLATVLAMRVKHAHANVDKVELSYRRGAIVEKELGRLEQAIEIYRGIVDGLDPLHAESLVALAKLYTDFQQWNLLYGVFEKQLDVVVGDGAQADVLARMARLAGDYLDKGDLAIDMWKKVLDLRGEDVEALNALGDMYARQENWRDLVDILEREVAIVDDDAQRIAIYSDLGRVWYEKLSRERSAIECWERVLDIDPSATGALTALAAIYRAGQHWQELIDTLSRLIEVGGSSLEDDVVVSAYLELGELYSAKKGQPLDAVESYRSVLATHPTELRALDALERILRSESMWEDLVETLDARVAAVGDPAEKVLLLLEIARVFDQHVGEADRGTAAYERVLALDPGHVSAFVALEGLHRAAGRWDALVELLLARVEVVAEVNERVELLHRVASIYESELGDANRAFDALLIAWNESFTTRKTADELERLVTDNGRWNELLSTANDALKVASDTQSRIAICLSCAKWYGVSRKRPEYGLPYIDQVLQLDPEHVEGLRLAAALHRASDQYPELAKRLESLSESLPDPREKADVMVELGTVYRANLGDPARALALFTKAAEVDPSSSSALDALESVYREAENWALLLEVLRRKVASLTDPREVQLAKLRIAEAYEQKLGDLDQAITVYREVLRDDAQQLDALRGLEGLYDKRQRWPDLLVVLESLFELAETDRERIALLSRIGGMFEEQFVKPASAVEKFEQVLDIDPSNLDAFVALERLYRKLQKWEELTQTLERHVIAVPERAEKVRLQKLVGAICAAEINDPSRAIDAYVVARQFVEDDAEVLDALAKLYEKQKEFSSALDILEQLLRVTSDVRTQVDLHYRIGRIQDEELADRAAALEHYEAALDGEPTHLPSLEALRKAYLDNADWVAAARILERESEAQQNPRLAAKLLSQLGQVYGDRLEEPLRAVSAFERALSRNPDDEEAALPLGRHYVGVGRFAEAAPILETLVKRSGKRELRDQYELALLWGKAAAGADRFEEAARAYAKAHQLEPGSLDALVGLASAEYGQRAWERAFKYYQMVLVQHREELTAEERAEVFFKLGTAKVEQGEGKKALGMFDKSLEELDGYEPSLLAIISVYEADKDWGAVVRAKQKLLEYSHGDARSKLAEEVGDLLKEKLDKGADAAEAYEMALEANPDSHKLLHKLLAAYQGNKNWDRTVEIIQRVSDLDDRASAKAKYAYTIGVILRDELEDHSGALTHFNAALDLDPDQLKPFESINKILQDQKDWKQLERAYRKMLHRVVGKGNANLEYSLWHALGVIYRDRQKENDNAIEAFKMASQADPENALEHQILAQLYQMVPSREPEAIAEHQWLLRQDPFRTDSYRALYKIYFDTRFYDKAWCIAATQVYLQTADAEQQRFYEQYKPQGVMRPQARLSEERWLRDLVHPEEDLYTGKIFELVSPAVHELNFKPEKEFGINKKQQVDENSTVTFAKTYFFVGQVLNLRFVPPLYLRPDVQGGLLHAPTKPPSSVCGSTPLSGFSPAELLFLIGKHLSHYRGEHFIRTMIPTHDQLKLAFLAAMQLAGIGVADPNVEKTAQQLAAKLPQVNATALREAGRKFLEAGAKTDVKQWMQTVELTGCRVGFLLAGELKAAAAVLGAEPPAFPGDLSAKEKMREVVLFSVSEEYFRLREALGVQIKVG